MKRMMPLHRNPGCFRVTPSFTLLLSMSQCMYCILYTDILKTFNKNGPAAYQKLVNMIFPTDGWVLNSYASIPYSVFRILAENDEFRFHDMLEFYPKEHIAFLHVALFQLCTHSKSSLFMIVYQLPWNPLELVFNHFWLIIL